MYRVVFVASLLMVAGQALKLVGVESLGPGPLNYCQKGMFAENVCQSALPVFVNRLDSEKSLIPYEYSHFDFCQASNNTETIFNNLGQMVFGDRIQASPYKLEFMKDQKCVTICTKSYKADSEEDEKRLNEVKKAMKLNYNHHWIVDNMPVTWCYCVGGGEFYCANGHPVGCLVDSKYRRKDACVMNSRFKKPNTYYLFNHVDLRIKYQSGDGESWGSYFSGAGGRILSIIVNMRSIKHNQDGGRDNCDSPEVMAIPDDFKEDLSITYSYSVTFTMDSEISWSSRWDYILDSMSHTDVQWLTTLNSLVIMLILTGLLAVIMLRTFRGSFDSYVQRCISYNNRKREECWKLVYGDVFRPPQRAMLLSGLVGSGTQVFITTLITLLLAFVGFLSPANRGILMSWAMVVYACLGLPAGYVAARLYKTLGGEKWMANILVTSMLCPGVVVAFSLILNLLLCYEGSSSTIPAPAFLALLSLWLLVSVPLTFIGSFFGYRKQCLENPVPTNQTPRQIPKQRVICRPLSGILIGGVFPFLCIYIQFFMIFTCISSSYYYYMFGFLFVVFLIFVVTCSQTTVLLCYMHLCTEDYHWWWRSFLTAGCTAFYLFIYCIYYFFSKLSIHGVVSTMLYFGYTIILTFFLFLLAGTIGFIACFWFVRKIYTVVEVDQKAIQTVKPRPQTDKVTVNNYNASNNYEFVPKESERNLISSKHTDELAKTHIATSNGSNPGDEKVDLEHST